MWLPALLASSLVSLQIFIKAGVAVCCLLLQLIFPFSTLLCDLGG